MEDQQYFVISPDGEELTLMDTEGGILVEQGTYSITIPQQTQQQVVYTQPQQTVYTTPQQVQQRVVYSAQHQQQQVYQIGPPHAQQVVYAGGPAIKQQPQHTQQILLQQQQQIVPQQQVAQQQQITQQQVVQHQQIATQATQQQVISQQKQVTQQQITQQQMGQPQQITQQQQIVPQQQVVQQQQLMQQPQQHHHHQQQQQQQQQQPQQFITPQGQRIISRTQNPQEQLRQQQQVHQKPYQLQLQQQQQPQQQVQHLPLQQQQLVQQGSPQLQQQLVLQPHQLVQQPQLQQQPQQIIQAGQPAAPQQITYIQHRIEDEKGVTRIVRTPVSVGSIRTRSPAQVGGQAGSGISQSTSLLHPNTSHVVTGPAVRSANPQAVKSTATSRVQQPRLQRNNPVQRQASLGIQQQLPQQQQQQQPPPQEKQSQQQQQQQQQDEQQPSYQEQYLKQLQNRIHTQQKGANRSKVGAHTDQSAVSAASVPPTSTTAKQQPENHQQQVKQVTLQTVAQPKKLTLHQYRQRASQDLKQQQQPVQKLVTASQGTVTGEEVRIPLPTNNAQKQQYYYVQHSDGRKVLAVFPVEQGATAVAISHPVSNMTSSSTSGRSTHFTTSAPDGNTVITVKHQDGPAQPSSSGASTQLALSSARSISSNNVSSTNSSSTSPPLQEHVVHSSVSSEQTEKSSADKPRFIAGQVSLCNNCGILSEDLFRCQRCNHKLPMQTRPEPPTTTSGSKAPTCDSMTSKGITMSPHMSKQDFYGKTGGGNRRPEKKTITPANNKAKGKGRGKGKAPEEPVILTLSSDEEDDKHGGSSGGSGTGSGAAGSPKPGGQSGHPEPVNHKEPIITADMENFEDSEKEGNAGVPVTGGGIPDIQSLNDGTLKGPYTSLLCRSLRIGSYKVMPKERILIVPQGLRIEVPPITEDSTESVTFDIPVKSVVKILVHFGRSLPVFFIYVKPSTAASIRRLLKMTDKNGYYFDPCSHDESQKRITILPDRLTEENKNLVKEVFGHSNLAGNTGGASASSAPSTEHVNVIEELDHKEANEILLRASSAKVQNLVKKPVAAPATCESKLLIIYPPPPQKGGISISADDYCCLEEEQFLNDVILDFYLKWLLQSKLSEIHRQHTHVFSTFFYKRLTSKPKKRRLNAPEDDPKLSAAEKRHARVKSWTKNVDIFSKDFIIIPINEHAHWFLAIICFPGLSGPVRISDGQPVPVPTSDKPKRRRSTRPKNRIEIPIIDDGEWSDRDEAEGEEDELEEDEEEEEETQPSKKKQEEELSNEGETQVAKPDSTPPPSIKQPCILIFDSLTGANRARIVATLRDYLTVEHKVRKGTEKLLTRDTMKGACPRVPQQMNYSDCGIYTLQFAESFFEDPIKDYTFPIRSLNEWFPQEVVRGKREAIAKLIANLMEQHNPNHSSITLPDIYFSSDKKEKGGANMASVPSTSDPQDGCPTSNAPLTKGISSSAQNTVAGQDIKTANNVGSENASGPSKEQNNSKLIGVSPNTIIEGKLKDGETKVCHSKEGGTITKPILTAKAVQSKAISTKPIPLCVAKSDQAFSICPSQLNVKKFQKPPSIERNIAVQKLSTVPVEGHIQVNNMKRQFVVESDEPIFPLRDKKKVPMKETNVSLVAAETTVSASNHSGLSLIKTVYNGDSNDGIQVDTRNEGININGNKSCLQQVTTDFSGIKNITGSDANGMHAQVVYESPMNDKIDGPENNSDIVNGDESVSKTVEDEVLQVVSTSQSGHSTVIPKISYIQTTSVAGMPSPKYITSSPANISVQQNVVFSSANIAKSVALTSCTTGTHSRKVISPSKMPTRGNSYDVDETQSLNQTVDATQAVDTTSQLIIDSDTAEVLLIMNPTNPSHSDATKSDYENLPAKQNMSDNKDYMNIVESTEVMPSRTVVTQPLAKPITNLQQDRTGLTGSPVRRVGTDCTSSLMTLPPGSSSPSQGVSGTPAVFRFSERGTSSGRTIAPPKRYLDDDDEIFPKKRRDKPAQGKSRNVVR